MLRALLLFAMQMHHVNLAITEMFDAVHMQLLRSACKIEKILLACIVLETKSRGQ